MFSATKKKFPPFSKKFGLIDASRIKKKQICPNARMIIACDLTSQFHRTIAFQVGVPVII